MWKIIVDSTPQILLAGLQYTVTLSILSFIFGLIIATIVALLRREQPRQQGMTYILWRITNSVLRFYVWLFRSTPLLVQLFIIFYGLPSAGIQIGAFPAAVITFSLNVGAYASETVRAALDSVPQAQWEAAATLGLSRRQTIFEIIFPQAIRIALPPLSNEFIGLVKDTSLASTITIVEMFAITQQITAKNYQPLLMYSIVAVIYAFFSTILVFLQKYLEKRTSRYLKASALLGENND
ncbi:MULTISPECIES: amino acid ABC transporter permease [Leuconostoc]|mgnify:CR=1 FL=1|uniref:Amino acid ABC transporter, permease protein n=2 Tax=Leuconostoc kimchii TaxID=136609 RepID=D5T1R8_LEUKI|nr:MULTISPECIES: amino acid ABC transporter permease [Leuconostoc]ADG40217.1 amino acid ABC transporter, permease protein [Leuconostoc kimchii IMSNU 11154]AEJ31842.1 amino acid ABC transporter, permease protein [Leuconostoc sp. C2]QBR46729.1 amino acid ABC transporter permease [Leuconostoc kimchii]